MTTEIEAVGRSPQAEPPRAQAAAAHAGPWLVRVLRRDGVAALVALAVLVVVGSLLWPSFHSLDNARSILLGNAYLGLVAIGMTFVIVAGGIDLSVGSVFALGGVVGVWTNNHAGVLAAVAATALAGAAVGLVNGALVAYARLAPFIVTLATLFGVRGLVYQLTNAGATTYSVPAKSAFATLGTGTWLTLGIPVFLAIAAYAIGHVLLERTSFGLGVQSVGGGESAALLMGLNVRRVKTLTYMLSGVFAALAGMLQAAQLVSASPIIATGYELQAIATVVIGGTLLIGGSGSLLGTGAGVVLLGVIDSFIVELQLNSTWNNVISGGFLVLVVVLQRLVTTRVRV